MDCRNAILAYLDHIEDTDYIPSALKGIELSDLKKIIVDLLKSTDFNCIQNANLLIRDLVLVAPKEIKEWFRTGLYDSEIIEALHQNVFSDDHFVRRDAVYTLGKVYSVKSSSRLRQALTQFKESDPLLIPHLMFEIKWLEGQADWTLIDELLKCDGFIARWFAVSLLKPTRGLVGSSYFEEIRNRLLRMKNDSSPFVRAEAEFRLMRLHFCEETLDAPKEIKTKQRKELKRAEPKISIDHLENLFTNHLRSLNREKFCTADVESFVLELAQ